MHGVHFSPPPGVSSSFRVPDPVTGLGDEKITIAVRRHTSIAALEFFMIFANAIGMMMKRNFAQVVEMCFLFLVFLVLF